MQFGETHIWVGCVIQHSSSFIECLKMLLHLHTGVVKQGMAPSSMCNSQIRGLGQACDLGIIIMKCCESGMDIGHLG